MRKRILTLLKVAVVLATIGISAQAQPTIVTEVPKASINFVTAGDFVYFTSRDSLLRTNGTDEGTILLRKGFTDTFSDFTEFNDMLFFISGNELWTSDGTPSGTVQLIMRNELEIFTGTDQILFFQGTNATTGRELYKTDGTAAGTAMIKDINPGPGHGFLPLVKEENNPIMNGEYYFSGNPGSGLQLWKSDGTAAGTVVVKDVRPSFGNDYNEGGPLTHNNLLFFSASTATHGMEPWVSDGTSEGTFMIKDIAPGPDWSNLIRYGIGLNGAVYFITLPPANQWGNEDARHTLWKTSGTNESTVKLAELGDPRSTFFDPFRIYKNKVYFFERIYGGPHFLNVTDGTAGGTRTIFNMQNYEGLTRLNYFDVVGDYLMFYGTADGYPTPFFRSDGTTAGTHEFTRFTSGGYQRHPRDLTQVADLIFYGDHDGPGYEGEALDPDDYFHLIQSDGVTTASMRTMYGISTIGTNHITDYNGVVVFTTQDDQFESTDRQKYLWIYDPGNSGNEQVGKIQQEVWNNVTGTNVSSIPVNTEPSSVKDLTIFETATNVADNYGSRVRGYVVPPATGDYSFWIASDDQSQLWLSTDDDPAKKRKIAEVTGWTTSRQWDRYASQQSVTISLVQGRKYYIEALHKEGTGGDNLAVGWQLPDGTMERPIPGSRLIPFSASENTLPQVAITSPEDGQNFTAPADILITAEASDSDGSITKVEFFNGTYLLGEDTSSPYSFAWNNVQQGSYTIWAKAVDNNGGTHTHSVDITVTEGSACEGAGMIRQEFWTGVSGTRVSDIPVNEEPDFTQDLTMFEGPASAVGDNYASRIRGYICPPATGNYVFWIAGDDQVELSLSTDDDPANKTRIAYHMGWTNKREWTKYTPQQSAPVILQAGQRYYIEALMKEGAKADHVSVGWQLPNGTLERPIPANRLMLFQNEDPVVEFVLPADGRTFTAGESIQISLNASDSDGRITKIQLYSVDLETNEQIMLGTLESEPYWMYWHPTSGHNYRLIAEATDNAGGTATDTVSVFAHPEHSGTIQAEVWTGIPGTHVSSIPLNSPPSSVLDLTTFETPANIGDNYGIRVRGYIYVLNTGDHTFWIASDDRSELWLSTDESPANKARIAYVDGATTPRRWDKYPTQKSTPIPLVAGRRYYIEALLKEGTGDDHLAVGWQLPSGALQRPIPSQWLIPFESTPPTGTIDIETWTGISGTHISSIPVDSPPDFESELTIFETPLNVGDNYGSRVRGYIHAPTTGNYTFWTASDDRSELWLSTDEDPANKVRIAYVSGWTSSRQWDKYSSQRSAQVSLVGGRKYYIEALLKEGTGADHLAVGWQLPDGTMERPIPGSRLSPFESASAMMASQSITSEEKLYEQISVYPNPAKSGDPELTISGYEGIEQTIETRVEIINMTGEVVFSENVLCGGDCGSYLMKVNKQLVPGVYVVNMQTNGVRTAKRLLVK